MSGDFIESSVKVVGEFGLRENLYYGSIFLCMTLIVIVCFLVINNRAGGGGDGSGTAAAMFDGGECLLKIPYVVQQGFELFPTLLDHQIEKFCVERESRIL